jgi:hypothetical protein
MTFKRIVIDLLCFTVTLAAIKLLTPMLDPYSQVSAALFLTIAVGIGAERNR